MLLKSVEITQHANLLGYFSIVKCFVRELKDFHIIKELLEKNCDWAIYQSIILITTKDLRFHHNPKLWRWTIQNDTPLGLALFFCLIVYCGSAFVLTFTSESNVLFILGSCKIMKREKQNRRLKERSRFTVFNPGIRIRHLIY